MGELIALYICYFLWKSTVEAVVNIVALARGKPAVGDGKGGGKGDRAGAEAEGYGRYFTRGLGTVFGGLLWAFTEAGKSAWAAADAKYGERLDDARERRRYRRRAKRRGSPEPEPGCVVCGDPIDPADPALAVSVSGTRGLAHARCARGDTGDAEAVEDEEAAFRCARCGVDLDENSSIRLVPEGWVCNAHFDTHCAACGQPPRDGDPLVLDGGAWVHRSHTRDPADSGGGEPICPACWRAVAGADAAEAAGGEVVHTWCLCVVCGRAGSAADPLTTSVGRRVHRSHIPDPDGGGGGGRLCRECKIFAAAPGVDRCLLCLLGLDGRCQACGKEGSEGDPVVTVTAGGTRGAFHRGCAPGAGAEDGPTCPACHQEIGSGEAVDADGQWVHLWCRCATCNRAGSAGDPLVAHEGRWVHKSHVGGEPADVTDATGRPVDAVWELDPAPWASVHPRP